MGNVPIQSAPQPWRPTPSFSDSQSYLQQRNPAPLFDGFAPLGPSSSSPASGSFTDPSMSRQTRGQPHTHRMQHPNAPFERAAVEDLTSQLAGTSLSSTGAMWPRRSGVVKFFNSNKGGLRGRGLSAMSLLSRALVEPSFLTRCARPRLWLHLGQLLHRDWRCRHFCTLDNHTR